MTYAKIAHREIIKKLTSLLPIVQKRRKLDIIPSAERYFSQLKIDNMW